MSDHRPTPTQHPEATTMQDLIDRLDAELRAAPAATFTSADMLPAGRRAVRRRRLAVGAGGVVAAVLIGGLASITGGGTVHGRDDSVAGEPSASASATPEPWPAELADEPLRSTAQGWQVNPRAKVLARVEFATADGRELTAFRLRFQGHHYLAVGNAEGDWAADGIPVRLAPPLRRWAAQQLTMDDGR